MLKSVKINGLRGYGKQKTINLSLPNGIDEGSGLNIIVGPNNSGKTTIFEAIKYYNQEFEDNISFSEGKRNKKNNNKIDLVYVNDKGEKYEIHTVDNGGSKVKISEKTSDRKPFSLPSRRGCDYIMHNGNYIMDRDSFSSNSVINSYNRNYFLNQYEARIFGWQKRKTQFDNVLKKIITEPFDWSIDQNDEGGYFVKILFKNGNIIHTREGMGDGYWSILTIVDALYDSQAGDIIEIDEPELSLHPTLQKRVINLLELYSKDRQIIITTHSSYFVSLKALVNGGNLIRTYKDVEGNINVANLTEDDKSFIKSIIADLNNPHILGLEAKELFFTEDNIIVTEGQEDVVIIPKICKELGVTLNAELFGWGAGGAEKIIKVLNMLNNLGYEKVTAIFDGDKKYEYNYCKKNYPNYNIKLLFKDDIRDKDKISKEAKEGVAYKNGIIKEENRLQFKDFLCEINEYHNKKSL